MVGEPSDAFEIATVSVIALVMAVDDLDEEVAGIAGRADDELAIRARLADGRRTPAQVMNVVRPPGGVALLGEIVKAEPADLVAIRIEEKPRGGERHPRSCKPHAGGRSGFQSAWVKVCRRRGRRHRAR